MPNISTHSFESKLLCEGIRSLEKNTPKLELGALQTAQSFEKRLFQRASRIDNRLEITAQHLHFNKIKKAIFTLITLFFMLLGATAVLHVFFSGTGVQVNFFWSFVLFFIPNLISLLLWAYLFFFPKSLASTYLAKFSLFLIKRVDLYFNLKMTQKPHYWALFKSYFHQQFSGAVGRYQLSMLTHRLWLAYFLSASLVLTLKLATNQVDFIWETSLLSVDHFTWLTQKLGLLPAFLGLPVPDTLQIENSKLGMFASQNMGEVMRFTWSSLLVSSLILYGVLPRLILSLLMQWRLKQVSANASINLSLPYYIELRQLFSPATSYVGVIDEDEELRKKISNDQQSVRLKIASSQVFLPEGYFPLALELTAADFKRVKTMINEDERFKNIESYDDQKSMLALLDQSGQENVRLYLSLSQLPDRGVLRFINALKKNAKFSVNIQIALLEDKNQSASPLKNQREADWLHCANELQIPFENIVRLSTC